MKEKKQIGVIVDSPLLVELYKKAIDERNELNPDNNQYELVHDDKRDILLIQFNEQFKLEDFKKKIEENHELKALVFLKPSDIDTWRKLINLSLDYPLSIIAIAIQPIQGSRIWDFLDRVDSHVFHFEWEDGDWDDI